MLWRGDCFCPLREFPAVHYEIAARRTECLSQTTARDWFLAAGPAGWSATLVEPNDLERLADVQVPRFAVHASAVVIEHAIGNVRMLLNFAEHHARPDRVRRSRWHIYGVSRMHVYAAQTILSGPIRDGAFKRFSRHPRFEANAHGRAFARAHHVPHFRFADAACRGFVRSRILVVGMDLHG